VQNKGFVGVKIVSLSKENSEILESHIREVYACHI
jgi:hypothetical protein